MNKKNFSFIFFFMLLCELFSNFFFFFSLIRSVFIRSSVVCYGIRSLSWPSGSFKCLLYFLKLVLCGVLFELWTIYTYVCIYEYIHSYISIDFIIYLNNVGVLLLLKLLINLNHVYALFIIIINIFEHEFTYL